jgi:hypothetical protein
MKKIVIFDIFSTISLLVFYVFVAYLLFENFKYDIVSYSRVINISWVGIVAISYTRKFSVFTLMLICLTWSCVMSTLLRQIEVIFIF